MVRRRTTWIRTAGSISMIGALMSLNACEITPTPSDVESFTAAAPSMQDVSVEHGEPTRPGAIQLCESPNTFVPFDSHVERQVYDVLTSYKTGLTDDLERLTAKVIVEESRRYGLDPWLVVGVIRVESRFYNFAESHKDARGLMQIRPFVAVELASELGMPWHGADSLYNPVKNVKLGTYYLSYLHKRFDGNVEQSLMAYNMGPTRVRRWLNVGRELPTGYAELSREYQASLGRIGKASKGGQDLRSPITAVERSIARRNAVSSQPVAEIQPVRAGVSDASPARVLVGDPEPPIELMDDADAPIASPADPYEDLSLAEALMAEEQAKQESPEPAIPAARPIAPGIQ